MPKNAIQRSKLELDAEKAARKSLEDSITNLRSLMHSDKFRENPYVNIVDILTWAEQAMSAASDAESASYAVGRMRQAVYSNITTALDTNGANALYKVDAFALEGPETRTVYVLKSDVEFALEVLRADGIYYRAELSEWEDARPWEREGRWLYAQSVTL